MSKETTDREMLIKARDALRKYFEPEDPEHQCDCHICVELRPVLKEVEEHLDDD